MSGRGYVWWGFGPEEVLSRGAMSEGVTYEGVLSRVMLCPEGFMSQWVCLRGFVQEVFVQGFFLF